MKTLGIDNDGMDAGDPAVTTDDETALDAISAAGETGIFAELGALPAGAIVNESALAKIFHRHPESIKRAIKRGELPVPARMFGNNCWTAGAILRHLEKRLEAAAKESERQDRRMKEHCA